MKPKKEPEKTFMPENANIPKDWIQTVDLYYTYIPFPSKTDQGIYNIRMDNETRQLFCECKGFQYHGVCSHVKIFRWVCKKKPRGTHVVSIEARLSLSEKQIEGDSRKIIDKLKMEPHTSDELEKIFDMRHQTVSARLSELRYAGFIEQSGLERPTRSGRNAIVWQVT